MDLARLANVSLANGSFQFIEAVVHICSQNSCS